MTLDHDTEARVSVQVARNDARLDAYYSGSTEAARRGLSAREEFLREKVLGEHG